MSDLKIFAQFSDLVYETDAGESKIPDGWRFLRRSNDAGVPTIAGYFGAAYQNIINRVRVDFYFDSSTHSRPCRGPRTRPAGSVRKSGGCERRASSRHARADGRRCTKFRGATRRWQGAAHRAWRGAPRRRAAACTRRRTFPRQRLASGSDHRRHGRQKSSAPGLRQRRKSSARASGGRRPRRFRPRSGLKTPEARRRPPWRRRRRVAPGCRAPPVRKCPGTSFSTGPCYVLR